MCGFAALFGTFNGGKSRRTVQKMVNSISHRGPDDIKIVDYENFTGGFARLSIIDLKNRANQPFILNKNDNLVLFYNGETYNYKELKLELEKLGHNFITSSDTEVVYRSILQWGNDFVHKLNGMFSILIYRPKSNQVELFRDHLGVKPLYYFIKSDLIYISSEVKGISNVVDLKINEKKISEYMRFGTNLDENLIFKNVKTVLPGQHVIINKDLYVRKKLYFDLIDTFNIAKTIPDQDFLEQEVINSILLHTRSDVRYGAQLSGGLDSSLIASIIANKSDKPLKTFSVKIDHDIVDESRFQENFIEHHKIDSTTINYNINTFNDLEYLKRCIYFNDFPLHHPNIVASDMMNEQASKEGFKVLLSGEGADEIFAGYSWHLNDISSQNYGKILNNSSFNKNSDVNDIFSVEDVDYNENLFFKIDSISNPSDRQLYFDQRYYLQKWFHRQDRSGMRFSLEIRVPYCTHILASILNSYDIRIKTRNYTNSKYV